MSGAPRSWFDLDIRGPRLSAEHEAEFARERDRVNRSRMRLVLPALFVGHLVHVWAFWVTQSARAELGIAVVEWRQMVVAIHAITAGVVLVLTAALFLTPPRATRWLAPLSAVTYLVHAAAIAGADQLQTPTVTPYLAMTMVIAILLLLEPLPAMGVYGIGLVAYLAALFGYQPDPEIRRTFLLNGPMITVPALGLIVYLDRARRREFGQRHTITTQQQELETLNTELEQRVEEQTEVISTRAAEVHQLNSQLRVQVQDRSRELARALVRLSESRDDETLNAQGRLLGGRFEVRERIGLGGMGSVYEGHDLATRQRVAIKLIRTDFGTPLSLLRRFLQEAETVAGLTHPAIVRMLHIDIAEDGTLYQVQELIHGQTLGDVLHRHGRFSPGGVARVVSVAAEALAAAHAKGVIHRDVKPGNLMLTWTPPGIKLLDFGIARVREQLEGLRQEAPPGMTRTGGIVGTPGYMAPEQISLVGQPSGKSDVFALGVVGFLLLGGEHPFGMERRPVAAADVAKRFAGEHVPLVGLLARCLEQDPARRPEAGVLAAESSAIADAALAPDLWMLAELDTRPSTTDASPTLLPD